MTERGVWLGGLAALAVLAFFCIRHHLGDADLAAAAPAAVVVAPPAPAAVVPAPAPVLAEPRLTAKFDGKSVVLEGTVADDAARQALVTKANAVYGAANVQDRLQLAAVGTPAWAAGLAAAFPPDLRGATAAGSFSAADGAIVLEGEMKTTKARDELVAAVTTANPQARIDNRLTVAEAAEPLKLRGVEFALGSAQLTPRGQSTLDGLVPALQRDKSTRFEIAGHTDNVGTAPANLALSEARAKTVAAYLTLKGVSPERFVTKGYGDTAPVADNATPDGRQRNRRIEFRPL